MNLLITLTLLSTVAMSGFRRLKLMTGTFMIQSLSIAFICFFLGYETNEAHYYALGMLTILIKAIVIPIIMNKSINKLKTAREMNMIINGYWSYIFSSIFVVIALMLLKNFRQDLIKTGLVLILFGTFILITRKKAINQMIGFLTVENGIVLIELSTVQMNLAIEFGIF
ncbi:hydrogenase [Caloramator sp. mosi_1]|uniref:hydrogenase n=1 Tax=Caloramator sp. mosi_1 TaxID=3023090 RepID=UPI0023613002|nr:hydrogenase [Caloramator sp. mosi_1]WDC85175.1 hydrogenase [Caloramator sp. mosi_1]